MTGVTSTPLLKPSSSISRSPTMVRNVLPVPLSPARQTALGSSSRPKYFSSTGCLSTCNLNESRRRLNSFSRPIMFEGENFSGGYSRSSLSWIFLKRRGETRALLHRTYDLSTVFKARNEALRSHLCLSHQGLTEPNRNSDT